MTRWLEQKGIIYILNLFVLLIYCTGYNLILPTYEVDFAKISAIAIYSDVNRLLKRHHMASFECYTTNTDSL